MRLTTHFVIVFLIVNAVFAADDIRNLSLDELFDRCRENLIRFAPVTDSPQIAIGLPKELKIPSKFFITLKNDKGLAGHIPEEVINSAIFLNKINTSFWNLLVEYVNQVKYVRPMNRKTVILSIGCGKADESHVLSAFFGNEGYGTPSKEVKVIGIDKDENAIKRAQNSHYVYKDSNPPTTRGVSDSFEFIHGDATHLDKYSAIPAEVDVVVVRHQEISDSNQNWEEIIKQGYSRLRPGGIMIFTSFSSIENEMLIQQLKSQNLNIALNAENRFAFSLSSANTYADRMVTIVSKPE